MNGPATPVARRLQVLRALGITPWVRRHAPGDAAVPATESQDAPAAVACVVVVPAGCSTRELDLLGRALSTAGAVLARAARLTVSGGQLTGDVPAARAYLVFGEAQAHALGRALPAAVMHQAQIVLADIPSQVLIHGDAKRRLWSAMRSLRRSLGGGEG
jgi:hypothetical protein